MYHNLSLFLSLPIYPHTVSVRRRASSFVLFVNSRKACAKHFKLRSKPQISDTHASAHSTPQPLWPTHYAFPHIDPLPNGCHKTRNVPSLPEQNSLCLSVPVFMPLSVYSSLSHLITPSGVEMRHKGAGRQDGLPALQRLYLTALFSSRSHFLKKCLVLMC